MIDAVREPDVIPGYEPKPVVTIDGRTVMSNSEEWRRCCEAVYWLGHVAPADRKALFERIEKRRGPDGRRALEDEMRLVEPWFVLAMGGREVRRAYLAQVDRFVGPLARENLERRVVAAWEARKAAAPATTGPADPGETQRNVKE